MDSVEWRKDEEGRTAGRGREGGERMNFVGRREGEESKGVERMGDREGGR